LIGKEISKLAKVTEKTVVSWKKNKVNLFELLKNLSKEEVIDIINRTKIADEKLKLEDIFIDKK
jgi:hypothetical protein